MAAVEADVIRATAVARTRTRAAPAVVWAPAALVAAAMLLPLAYLVLRALGAGSETWDLLFRGRTLQILARTVSLTAAVTAASIAIAVPLAWLTVRTDLPLRRLWSVLTVLPLAIPSYVGGFVVVAALGPKGMLQGLLDPLGVQRLPEIYGFPGAFLTLTLLSYPYALLTVRAALHGLDPSLGEASRSLGHGPWSTFRRSTLPQLRPAIAAGALLVALYTLHDFGAVSLLRYETFTWAIYIQYQSSFDRAVAAALSLLLVVLALGLVAAEGGARGGAHYHRSGAGSAGDARRVRLGRWRWPALAFASLVTSTALAVPVAVLGYWLARGVMAGEPLRLVWSAALNSVYVSALAALAAALAALPVAFLAVRHPGRLAGLCERFTYVGFGLPGIVVALSLVFFAANYATPFYQTLVLLVFAYVVLFLPAALGSIRASLLQISPRLEEAARGLGRPPLRVFLTITVPLLRPGILAGMALVFLVTIKELPATLLLSPIGFKTLASSIWAAASGAFFARAAAPALLLILISSLSMFFLVSVQRGERP